MPRIRCHYTECVFLDDDYCGAASVEFDPDTGCATYSPNEEAAVKGEDWENEMDEWEDEEADDEDDEWSDDDESEL